MGTISKNKSAFRWTGTVASLRKILDLQRYILKADAIARRLNRKMPLTLGEYLTKIY